MLPLFFYSCYITYLSTSIWSVSISISLSLSYLSLWSLFLSARFSIPLGLSFSLSTADFPAANEIKSRTLRLESVKEFSIHSNHVHRYQAPICFRWCCLAPVWHLFSTGDIFILVLFVLA